MGARMPLGGLSWLCSKNTKSISFANHILCRSCANRNRRHSGFLQTKGRCGAFSESDDSADRSVHRHHRLVHICAVSSTCGNRRIHRLMHIMHMRYRLIHMHHLHRPHVHMSTWITLSTRAAAWSTYTLSSTHACIASSTSTTALSTCATIIHTCHRLTQMHPLVHIPRTSIENFVA